MALSVSLMNSRPTWKENLMQGSFIFARIRPSVWIIKLVSNSSFTVTEMHVFRTYFVNIKVYLSNAIFFFAAIQCHTKFFDSVFLYFNMLNVLEKVYLRKRRVILGNVTIRWNISCHWCLSIPPGNIRKREIFRGIERGQWHKMCFWIFFYSFSLMFNLFLLLIFIWNFSSWLLPTIAKTVTNTPCTV